MSLSEQTKTKFDTLLKGKGVDDAAKKGMEKDELILLKSYSITKALNKGKYVRN